jgi:hypothetical protein
MLDEQKLKSKIKAIRFYEELERLLKRYRPEKYGPILANMIYELLDKPEQWRYYPLHFLIHSIEANCAYHRDYLDDENFKNHIDGIINHYKDYYDPYIKFTLSDHSRPQQRLFLPFAAMYRQQFVFQYKPSEMDLSRSLVLFTSNNPLPRTSMAFSQLYGLSMRDWIYMCYAVLSLAYERRPPIIRKENFLDSDVQSLPKHGVTPFLNKSSLTPEEIGKRYRDLRQKIEPYLHIFLPSIFLAT